MSEWRVYGGAPRSRWPDVGLVAVVVAVTVPLLWPSVVVEVDVAVRDWGQDAYQPVAYWLARGLTYLGQGLPLAIGCAVVAGWVARRYRDWRPLVLFASVYVGLAVVLLLKDFFDRVPPRWPEPGQPPYGGVDTAVLFAGEGGVSYPSGHMANTAVWYGLVVALVGQLLSRRVRVAVLTVPPVVVLVAQTYVGFHWLSDQPAGYALGLLTVRAARRAFVVFEGRVRSRPGRTPPTSRRRRTPLR